MHFAVNVRAAPLISKWFVGASSRFRHHGPDTRIVIVGRQGAADLMAGLKAEALFSWLAQLFPTSYVLVIERALSRRRR
jgi:hypothetical protein